MSTANNVSAKIRTADRQAIQAIAARYGSSGMHIISAMRRLWERSAESRRLEAIKSVNAVESPSRAN